MTHHRSKKEESTGTVGDATHYILGGAHVGVALAERLQAAGHRVAVVDDAHDSYGSDIVPGVAGDPANGDVLLESGVRTAATAVVATGSDRRNLLIAQLVRARFGVPRVIAFVNDPDRVPLFVDAGHEPFCVTTALAETFGETV